MQVQKERVEITEDKTEKLMIKGGFEHIYDFDLKAYPRLENKYIRIEFILKNKSTVIYRIADENAKDICMYKETLEVGRQKIDIDVRGLSTGKYFVFVRVGNNIQRKKIKITK